jgi:DNA polymerase-3 subunit delta'
MLPKIVIGISQSRPELLKDLSLEENLVINFEGNGAKVDELRSWINTGVGIMASRPKYSLIIWDADKLSPECQAVLLKPMEELAEKMTLILVAENENRLLPTILSRGVCESHGTNVGKTGYWDEIRKCWSSGPAACTSFVDGLEKEQAVLVMEEIVIKLKDSFMTEISEKRLLIIDLAITALAELKQTNINHKLSLDNFLLRSWKVIKASS